MSRDNFISDILDYLEEAKAKKWSDHVIKYDLNRMFKDYEDEVVEDVVTDIRGCIKDADSLTGALNYVEEVYG